MIRYLTALLALAVVLSGCTHTAPPSAESRASAGTAPDTRFAIIGSSGPVVGVNLYALGNYPAAYVRADGIRTLAYIRDVLHADAVDIVWNFYTGSRTSDAVDTTAASLSPANVAILTSLAQQDHLLVEYRPLIMISGDEPWEGFIRPADEAHWFDSYYQDELPYLRVAQQYGINEFVVATEMKDLNGSPLWPRLLYRASSVFHGVISYSADQSDYFSPTEKLLPVKYLGMDMYERLRLPAMASADQVTAAWESFFGQKPPPVLRMTSIDETGIAARAGAYDEPSLLGPPGLLDEAIQANWFTAACRTVQKYRLRAVFFWKVDLTDYPSTHPASSLSTFEGRAGARAISMCASILRGY